MVLIVVAIVLRADGSKNERDYAPKIEIAFLHLTSFYHLYSSWNEVLKSATKEGATIGLFIPLGHVKASLEDFLHNKTLEGIGFKSNSQEHVVDKRRGPLGFVRIALLSLGFGCVLVRNM